MQEKQKSKVILHSYLDELREQGLVSEIPDAEYAKACQEINKAMEDFDVEHRAMMCESMRIASQTFIV